MRRLVTVLLTIGVVRSPLAAQISAPEVDSARLLNRARTAQAGFEARRRMLLPTSRSGGGRCDERIGRFCYWYDEADTTLPREPEAIHRARGDLLRDLELLHDSLPRDPWLLGQRVRYLVEHGKAAAAAALTDGCPTPAWWCHALAGYARHAAERFAPAERAFERALEAMPAELACEWTDWVELLDDEAHRRIADLSCETRRAAMDSLLWLGQPLWARPGNDLETELLSRRVVDRLLRDSRSPQSLSWGEDVSELLLRYGWPIRWSVAEPSTSALDGVSVVGHERTPAFTFLPIPDGAAGWRFDLQRERPRSRYAPSYGRFVSLDAYQIARFPRGDSLALVVGLDATGDPSFAGQATELAVAVAVDPARVPVVTRRNAAEPRGTFVVSVPAEPSVVSVEVAGSNQRRFARAREPLAPLPREGAVVLSDPLLFEAAETLPSDLEAAAAGALASTRVTRRRPLGVYFEATGSGTDTLAVSVALVPEPRGLLGRIGQSLSLVKRRAPLTLSWAVGGRTERRVGQAFELDLRRLPPGRYTLLLTLTAPDGTERTVPRRLELLK